MSKEMRIDFVSDVSCPWCIIGLKALEQALDNVGDTVDAIIHFQPFELNPAMAPEGEDIRGRPPPFNPGHVTRRSRHHGGVEAGR